LGVLLPQQREPDASWEPSALIQLRPHEYRREEDESGNTVVWYGVGNGSLKGKLKIIMTVTQYYI